MNRAAEDDLLAGRSITIPFAWRGDGLLSDIRPQPQCLTAGLRAMYAELLTEPLPPHHVELIRAFAAREGPADEC